MKIIASLLLVAIAASFPNPLSAEFLPVHQIERQPFASATEHLLEALRFAGAPLDPADESAIKELLTQTGNKEAVPKVQAILDTYCVAGVHINPESRVKVEEDPVSKILVQQGWRTFLLKTHNEAGITPLLQAVSPNAAPQYRKSNASKSPSMDITMSDVAQRWLDMEMFDRRPLNPKLSGLSLEYRIIQL